MQRHLVVVILHASIYNQYKMVKICKFTFLQFSIGYRYYHIE